MKKFLFSSAVWIKGLVAAAVGGASGSVAMLVADPSTYNLADGKEKLIAVATVNAIVAAAAYLKKSPVPE